MTKETQRVVLENVLLGMAALWLGWVVAMSFAIGNPPLAAIADRNASPTPEAIGGAVLLPVFATFLGMGLWRSWPACLFALLFFTGMVPEVARRMEFHRVAALWPEFHPHGSALVLIVPAILTALAGAGLGVFSRRRLWPAVPVVAAEDASSVAERRQRRGKLLKLVGAILLFVPLFFGPNNPFVLITYLMWAPVALLVYLLGAVVGAKDVASAGRLVIATGLVVGSVIAALFVAGAFNDTGTGGVVFVVLGAVFGVGVLAVVVDLLIGAVKLLIGFVRGR